MHIIYQDENIVVCVKPVGIDAEHGLPGLLTDTLGGQIYTLHRLDVNVGGLMVYARNKATAAALSKCIADGSMRKEYVAVVHGTPPEKGDWEDLLFKDSRKNKVFVVKKLRNGVKKARLEFDRLSAGEHSTVHILLHTGRSHQIRVQFSSRGYPLVGDHKYGSRASQTAPLLFSCALTFPYQGSSRRFEARPPWLDENNCAKITDVN